MAIVIVCSHTGRRITLGDDRAGSTIDCPSCGKPHPVPGIRFTCPVCGKAYKAAEKHAGKKLTCKKCKGEVIIPGDGVSTPADDSAPEAIGDDSVASVPVPPSRPAKPTPRPTPAPHRSVPPLPPLTPTPVPSSDTDTDPGPVPLWRDPVKLAIATAGWCVFWLVLSLFGITLWATRDTVPTFLIVFVVISCTFAALSAYFTLQLLAAKHRAIKGHSVTLFFGMARLVTWEQNEGLIFLRDKKIAEEIYGPESGGGLRIIYPFLGEELRETVPLTVRLTWFEDKSVLTRESVQLTVKVAIWWRVCDLQAYFYRIDQEVHSLTDGLIPGAGIATSATHSRRGRREIAEIWVRTLAESCLRTLISGTSTFLIVSKRAASCLHVEPDSHSTEGDDLTPATPDNIAGRLKTQLQPRLREYGLDIDRVEIQEVQLPTAIQQAVDEVWVASTQPTRSRYEAQALQNRLMVLCEQLGKEAVGMTEIVKSLPAGTLVGNPLAALQAMLDTLRTPGGAALPPGSPAGLPAAAPGKPSASP